MTAAVQESQPSMELERETLVELRGLTVAYGDVVAVDGVDLAIGVTVLGLTLLLAGIDEVSNPRLRGLKP